MRRAVIEIAQLAKVGADLIGHLQVVQNRIVGKQPAVVGVDAQGRVAAIDGTEQPAEVVPDRAGVVGVAVLVRLADRFRGKQAAVFAEGAEQHPVQQLLGATQHVMPRHAGVVAAKPLEGVLPHVGIAEVELLGQVLADPLRFGQQIVEMAAARFGDHPRRAEQEDEPLQQGIALGKLFGVEPFVGLLVGSLAVKPGLPDGGNDDPIAGQVDGVAVALIDGRHAAAGKWPVQRVFRPFALQGDDELVRPAAEVAQHGVGELAFHLDVFLPGYGVARAAVRRPGVAEQLAEEVGQEVGQDFLFLERVRLA